MAVFTDPSDRDLHAFLARYSVGDLRSRQGIAEGNENSNFLLEIGREKLILTLFEKRVSENDLPFFMRLMKGLAAHGIVCPRPLVGDDGKVIRPLADKPAVLVSYLEGTWPREITHAHCRAVGEALARLHLAGQELSLARANDLGPAAWPGMLSLSRVQAEAVRPGWFGELEHETTLCAAHWPDGLPRGLIHADLFPDNVFFLGDQISGLIDFYFACTDLLAYDIAICLNAWCFDHQDHWQAERGRAFLEGYQSIRSLEPGEWEALPWLARGAALRFLLTRLQDWRQEDDGLLVTRKDPEEYWRKLLFHRKHADEWRKDLGV
ncbi:homoserine kinase [Magnetospira sp. QH-2]|uniref:homoserine kinase n=1 Tax=Magnetospira sp. (strain QH-2) TaxID=1288970 RepID=UPI0003E81B1B|nr:homoserine kinase [Magnetospira sp. QH-2]CCQ74898.1 homoserine kinase [Magnetospira sp. QH-2]